MISVGYVGVYKRDFYEWLIKSESLLLTNQINADTQLDLLSHYLPCTQQDKCKPLLTETKYLVLIWAMTPDTVEYNDWKTDQRHGGKIFGTAIFTKRLALGVYGLLLDGSLAFIGYQCGTHVQTTETIEGIKGVMTIIPLIGIALSGWLMWGYSLSCNADESCQY